MFDVRNGGTGQPLYWILPAISHGAIGGWV